MKTIALILAMLAAAGCASGANVSTDDSGSGSPGGAGGKVGIDPGTGGSTGGASATGGAVHATGGAGGIQTGTGGTQQTGGAIGSGGDATGGSPATGGSTGGTAGSPATGGGAGGLAGACGGSDLTTDSLNCGSCGHTCAVGQNCLAGTCYGYGSCEGRTNVDCFIFAGTRGFPCNPGDICTIQSTGSGTATGADLSAPASCACSFRNGSNSVSCAPGSICGGS